MSTEGAGGLKELHRLHLELAAVQEKLARGPRQVRARQQLVEKRQQELTEQQAKLKQLRMAADEKQLQLRSKETKIADLTAKLNMASTNREYDIIRSQIEADKMANSVLEDEILEALEKVDQMAAQIRRTEQELAAARAEEQRITQEVAAAEPGLKQAAAALESQLSTAESNLPGTNMDSYRRLVQAHGATALAAVENEACTACHSILAPQDRVNVATGRTVFCRSCGRLLYHAATE